MYASLTNQIYPLLIARMLVIALILIATVTGAIADDLIDETAIQARINWVPLALVREDDRDERCIKCGGRYQDPLVNVDRSVPPAQFDLEVTAGDTDITDETLYFSDNVTVSQGYRTLKGRIVSGLPRNAAQRNAPTDP